MKQIKYLVILLQLFPLITFGQNNFRSPGTFELGGSLGFSSQSASGGGDAITVLNSDLFIGIMALRGFEIGFRPGVSVLTNSSQTVIIYNLYLNPEYNFGSSSNIYPFPFLGGIIGYNAVKTSENNINKNTIEGLGYGGEAGLKFYLRGNSLLLVKFDYIIQNFNTGSSVNNKIDNISFGIGFRIFLDKKKKDK